jgi:hypothetical protein
MHPFGVAPADKAALRVQSAATVVLTKFVGVMSSLVLAVGRDG